MVNWLSPVATVACAPVLSVCSADTRFEPSAGHHRSGQTGDGALVSADRTEPVGTVLPGLAVGDDLVVAAADEVPPHEQGLAERWAAQQDQPGRFVSVIGDLEAIPTRGLIGQIGALQDGAADLDVTIVEQH